MDGPDATAERRALLSSLQPFQVPSVGRSVVQLATTGLLYVGLLASMHLALQVSFWLALALAVPTAGLVVRLFII